MTKPLVRTPVRTDDNSVRSALISHSHSSFHGSETCRIRLVWPSQLTVGMTVCGPLWLFMPVWWTGKLSRVYFTLTPRLLWLNSLWCNSLQRNSCYRNKQSAGFLCSNSSCVLSKRKQESCCAWTWAADCTCERLNWLRHVTHETLTVL